MKRILVYITLLFSICILSGFSSCQGPQYDEAELADMEEKGRALMQGWLDEHIPGAEVLTASAYIHMIPSGPHYLTDSVYGAFSYDGVEQDYEVEVEEESVYLSGDKRFFYERVKPYALESLGLSSLEGDYGFERGSAKVLYAQDERRSPDISYYDDDHICLIPGELALKLKEADPVSAAAFMSLSTEADGGKEESGAEAEALEDQEAQKDKEALEDKEAQEDKEALEDQEAQEDKEALETSEDADLIPWNEEACAIMDGFIRDPESRPPINVSGFINVPEEIELKDYNMAFFDSLKDTAGLHYGYVYLYQDFDKDALDPLAPECMGAISAEVTCSGWYTSYERHVRQPFEDFYIEYEEEYYSEESRDGKVTPKEQFTNDVKYLHMDRTKEGYSFSFTNDDWFLFSIITDGSSELFSHRFINRYDQAANLSPGDRYGGDRYIDRDIEWSQRADGLWTLTNEDGVYASLSNANELVIKDE